MVAIALHAAAPDKPALGVACNGCGVCCALETCPLGRLRYLRRRGPCPALAWHEAGRQYRCALATNPATFLPRRWVLRAIAAGRGCDCDAEVDFGEA